MKPNQSSLFASVMAIALLAVTLFGCTKETEEVAPVTATDSPAAPVLAEAPAFSETVEDISSLQFPESSATNGRTAAYGVTDYVDFDDEMALQIIPDQAAFTFASSPFYIQGVGNAWIHVKENNGAGYNPGFTSDYKHYHLSYPFCIRPDGKAGKLSNGNCVAANPVKQHRTLDTHHGSQWIKIYAYDYNSPQRTFDLLGIKVTNGPLQLWFKKKNGGWYRWSSLGEGTWNLSAHSTGITQVLISGSGSTSIGFDNVKVKVPYE